MSAFTDDCFVLMYKGVEVHFSKLAHERIPEEEDKANFLDNFFKHEPMNGIQWVTLEEVMSTRRTNPDATLPMYSIRNSEGDTLLIWPMLANANLHLY